MDLEFFTISVPGDWKYIKLHGIDSFVGLIKGPHIDLLFDYSDMEHANNLLQTEKEYIDGRDWMRECYFCKPGITYSGRIPDNYAKKLIHRPTKQQSAQFPKADYVADLTYKDSSISIPIELPAKIKAHYFQVDSDSKYIYKIIWPKISGSGETGIYILGRSSHQALNMIGANLSAKDQKLALQAFKTIELKSK